LSIITSQSPLFKSISYVTIIPDITHR